MKALITTVAILSLTLTARAQYTGGAGSGYASGTSKITWLNAHNDYRAPSIINFISSSGRKAALPTGITIKAKEVSVVVTGQGTGSIIWGDGNHTIFEYGTGENTITHSYQETGTYNIKITPYRRLVSLNVFWQ